MIITTALLDAGRSPSGGWTADQLAILGVAWPPVAGWKQKVLGQPIRPQDAQRFLAARRQHQQSVPGLLQKQTVG